MEQMYPDVGRLRYLLLFYRFVDHGRGINPTFHIQADPGCGDNTAFILLHEQQLFSSSKLFSFPQKNPLQSLSVQEGDIIILHTLNNEIVTAGGIWQVRWRVPREKRSFGGYDGRYVLEEIASSHIEMVEVEELLQEEEFALFEEAVAHATTFLEAQGRFSNSWFVTGREIGGFAPERIHKITPLPHNIRAVEHTWYIVLAGDTEDDPRQAHALMEVVYRVQNQKWQFSARILEEQDFSSIFTNSE